MEITELLKKIWSNILLVPEKRFDELTKDKDYKESFIYLLACMAISLPIVFAVSMLSISAPTGKIMLALTNLVIYVLLGIPFTYIGIGITHILLKLVGGKATFLKTIQIFIYGETTSVIFGTLPLIGWIFSLIALANITLGAKRIHNLSLLRTIVAIIIIPVIIAMILGFIFAAYFTSSNAFTGPAY